MERIHTGKQRNWANQHGRGKKWSCCGEEVGLSDTCRKSPSGVNPGDLRDPSVDSEDEVEPSAKNPESECKACTWMDRMMVQIAHVKMPGDPCDRPGYVYVVNLSNKKHVKVGRTIHPERRIKTYQCIDPDAHYTCLVHAEDHILAEKLAHNMLAKHRERVSGPGNELFSCNENVASIAVTLACVLSSQR